MCTVAYMITCTILAELPATAGWVAFELFARHRGKEVGIVLVERPSTGLPSVLASEAGAAATGSCCPTCEAIGRSARSGKAGSGGSGSGGSGSGGGEGEAEHEQLPLAPKCEHGEAAALLQVKKNSANKGRWFFSCCVPMGRGRGRGGGGRCNFFKWADDVSGALPASPALLARTERLFALSDHEGYVSLDAAAGDAGGGAVGEMGNVVRVVRLTFRRGMKGRFVLLTRDMICDSAAALPGASARVFCWCWDTWVEGMSLYESWLGVRV